MEEVVVKKKKNLKFIGRGFCVLMAVALISTAFNTFSSVINVVKDSTYANTNITYGEAFDEFFGAPKWSMFSAGNNQIVEFNGNCSYIGELVEVVIQWELEPETVGSSYRGYELVYMGINERPMSMLEAGALLIEVFK